MFLWSLLVVLATMVILNLTRLFLVFKVFYFHDNDEYVGGNLVVLLVRVMLVTMVTMITLNLTVLFLRFQGQLNFCNGVQISMISYL